MKFSTRARYGLRMMVELARELQHSRLVQLNRIAEITHLSVNYLVQLAIPLKNNGLIVGISGKKGGYRLARPPQEIKIREILEAVQGPLSLSDCVNNPEICLNSSFCEARMIWVLASQKIIDVFEEYSLADLIDREYKNKIRNKYPGITLLDPDKFMAANDSDRYHPAVKKNL